jgi:signal transduction histidine kinase
VPAHSEEHVLGLIFIGENSEGQYTYNDKVFLQWLVDHCGPTFERIRAYEKIRALFEQARKTASLIGLMNEYHHELKTPWVSLIMYAREEELNISLEDLKALILTQAKRSEETLNTMVKILNNQRKRKLTSINLNQIIKTVQNLFPVRAFKIIKKYSDIPDIMGDEQDLQILFMNLFKNAIESTNKNPISNTVMFKTEWDNENDQIKITLSDKGVGIPKDKLETIWNPATTTSTKQTGSGLGLSVVKRIVDEHHGRIEVNSEVNKGTTFILCFPTKSTDINTENSNKKHKYKTVANT